jgi:hypothetical protein
MLYMFGAVSPPIIRSSKTAHTVYELLMMDGETAPNM